MDTPAKPQARPSIWGKVAAISIALVLAFTLISQRRALTSFARNWEDFSEGSIAAKQLRDVQDVLEYIVLHKHDVSLVVYDVGNEAQGIFLNADTPRPLGSTMKLQLLGAYVARVARGELSASERVPLADWERFYLPRTDGGAHEYSLRVLREQGALGGERAALADIVQAMMRYSDNSAADYLMWRLGRAQITALPGELGMPGEAPVQPLSGLFLSWQSTRIDQPAKDLLARYQTLGAMGYQDEVWKLFTELHDAPGRSDAEQSRLSEDGLSLRLRDQAELARALGTRGRARAYADLMARLHDGALPGSDQARQALGWPLQTTEIAQQFDEIGTKGGSLPGLLTSAYYARAKGQQKTRVLALFFERLPIAVWLQLMQTFVHQKLEMKLLIDDAFLAQVKARLEG